jgi:S-adenosylmethionine:tRNA-ribosyltransferase-isomerase (queuine synthetase)
MLTYHRICCAFALSPALPLNVIYDFETAYIKRIGTVVRPVADALQVASAGDCCQTVQSVAGGTIFSSTAGRHFRRQRLVSFGCQRI